MALEQINDYGPGDNNFTSFQETLDATRRGMAEITLSNYDNDSAPDVKVGSVFENNGAFFQVTTSDITPTGYSGISNSTTFWLYFDESATAFIYSSTAPTWNDARQGWYSGDDRAFFSMYKDSGGTLYRDKGYILNKSYGIVDELNISGKMKWNRYLKDTNVSAQDIVDKFRLSANDFIVIHGHGIYTSANDYRKIETFGVSGAGTSLYITQMDKLGVVTRTTTTINTTVIYDEIEIMSNMDLINSP